MMLRKHKICLLPFILLFVLLNYGTCYCQDKPKKAIIWGITGQDGRYLANFLVHKGYEVYGIVRGNVLQTYQNLKDNWPIDKFCSWEKIQLLQGDISYANDVKRLIKQIEPDEIYNLAAQSSVAKSFQNVRETITTNCMGCVNIIDTLCNGNFDHTIKYFYAGSSEMFGQSELTQFDELSPCKPISPYALSKHFCFEFVKMSRQLHNLFACTGILFNHESPLRGSEFVSKIISRAVAEIKVGLKEHFSIGNLYACRDWGYAGDYIQAMWLMLQQDKPDDFVIATGKIHTVKEFIEEAFKQVAINISWNGHGIDEYAYDTKTNKKLVVVNPKFFRSQDPKYSVGNPKKAYEVLKWKQKIEFSEMVKIMVMHELNKVKSSGHRKIITQQKKLR